MITDSMMVQWILEVVLKERELSLAKVRLKLGSRGTDLGGDSHNARPLASVLLNRAATFITSQLVL